MIKKEFGSSINQKGRNKLGACQIRTGHRQIGLIFASLPSRIVVTCIFFELLVELLNIDSISDELYILVSTHFSFCLFIDAINN